MIDTNNQIARLEIHQREIMRNYSQVHPSTSSQPVHMYFPQTSHNSMHQLYERLTLTINQLKGAK